MDLIGASHDAVGDHHKASEGFFSGWDDKLRGQVEAVLVVVVGVTVSRAQFHRVHPLDADALAVVVAGAGGGV